MTGDSCLQSGLGITSSLSLGFSLCCNTAPIPGLSYKKKETGSGLHLIATCFSIDTICRYCFSLFPPDHWDGCCCGTLHLVQGQAPNFLQTACWCMGQVLQLGSEWLGQDPRAALQQFTLAPRLQQRWKWFLSPTLHCDKPKIFQIVGVAHLYLGGLM